MKALVGVLTALFRPATGLDRVGAAARWLWVPLMLLVVASVVVEVVIGVPLQTQEMMEQLEATAETGMDGIPAEKESVVIEGEEFQSTELNGGLGDIAVVAGVVMGALATVIGLLYRATFFFIAGKIWTNPVPYTTMLTLASISMLPIMGLNFIQAAYMAVTGDFLAYSGLGALVAPENPLEPPGLAYALLHQIDIGVIWGLLILAFALSSQAIGFQRKQITMVMTAFIAVTGILVAVPTLVAAMFLAAPM